MRLWSENALNVEAHIFIAIFVVDQQVSINRGFTLSQSINTLTFDYRHLDLHDGLMRFAFCSLVIFVLLMDYL